ncbi:TRAP transporter substrate-binding protein DctP [Vibrio sp. PP-XX7]
MKKGLLVALALAMIASIAYAKPIVLRATNTVGEDHPTTIALRFRESTEIEKRTHGEVKIEVYPGSQLGGNKEMVEGVALGTIDIAQPFAGVFFASYVPEMEILVQPFLFKTEDGLFKALDGKPGEILARAWKKGFIRAGPVSMAAPARSLIINIPSTTVIDLKGLKIRVIGVKTVIKAINDMGAIATPMNQSEVYSAAATRGD